MSSSVIPRLKQFIYQYDGELLRVPLARWHRLLANEQSERSFCNRSIHIIYAYVEMSNDKPVYCHRIEAVRYQFDEAGFCQSRSFPDFDLLSAVQDSNIVYLASRLQQREFRESHYWDVPPFLLNIILEKIWSETR